MLMVQEKTTAVAMYERVSWTSSTIIASRHWKNRLAKQRGFKRVPQLRGEYYGFAVDRKPFNDPRVRKAFAMAIDRRLPKSSRRRGTGILLDTS